MKNILVTGGAGFIGANFIHYLFSQQADLQITNLDALTYAGSEENLRGLPAAAAYHFVRGDILDGDLVSALLRERKIDTIVHFAAESHVDRSIHGPAQFVQTNVMGTLAMLEAARKVWLNEKSLPTAAIRFHHISTDEVFGTLAPGDPAWTEDIAYAPNSPYAASKAASDHLVRAYGHTYGLPISLTNCSNNYGPRQFPEKLIPLTILNALEGKPLPVYGDGQQIRDWLYVDDHCEAIYRILKNGRAGETYNVGGGNQPANLTIVETICDLLDELRPQAESHRRLIQFVADRPGHDRRYAMNFDKLARQMGWQPRHDLKSGLRATVRWYLENPAWVEKIRQQSDIQQWMQKNYNERKTQP